MHAGGRTSDDVRRQAALQGPGVADEQQEGTKSEAHSLHAEEARR